MENKQNYTLPIIVMFFLFAMISFVTGFQNPFGVILKGEIGLTNLESQIGNAANFIAYAFMGIPAGMILQKKGYKFSAIAAVVVGFVGVALMFLSSALSPGSSGVFAVYLIGAFVAGFSMCMLNTVVNPMLNTLGGGGKKGNQLLQYGGATNSLAATICPVLVGYLMGDNLNKLSMVDARPALYIAMGIFALAFIVLILSKLPEPILDELKKGGKKEAQPALSGAFKFSHFVGGIVAIFLYVGIEVGIPNMANLYMTTPIAEGGLELSGAVAGSLVGMYWFLMLVGRLAGGVLASKMSSKAMLVSVSSLALVLLLGAIFLDPATKVSMPGVTSQLSFAMNEVPVNILLLVLCGLCTSVMWGGIFNLAVEGLGKYTAVASGLFMVMVCGGGILPLIQGAVADSLGYLASYWVPFIGVCYLLYYALIGSRVTRRDESAE